MSSRRWLVGSPAMACHACRLAGNGPQRFDKELRLDKRLEAKDAVIGIWLCSLISTWAWCNNDALTHRTTDAGWPRSSDAPALTHAVQHQLSTGFNYNDRVPHVYKYIYI